MTEVRITSKTGGQKGRKEARFGGADPLALMELAKVYGMGEEKYARYNYLKGYAWSLSVDALFRHLFAFLAGEDRDPESGLLHTAHVAWHALTLTSFQQRRVGEDDRAPVEGGATEEMQEVLMRLQRGLGPLPYPDHADMSVDERREPDCCDFACYEDPWCACDYCLSLNHGPSCDHGVRLDRYCEPCSKGKE